MYRKKEQHVKDVVDALFKSLGLSKKRKEMIVINSWDSFVGKTIANATEKINIHNGVLFLKINSSIIRNELLMLKENIIDVVNTRLKEEIITDIVIK